MQKISKIAEDCLRESADDYIGLWQISSRIRRELRPPTNEQTKRLSLDVVRLIVERVLYPGDYLKTGFSFWDENDTDSIIARIDKEWDSVRGDPTLANPICWFAARRGAAADQPLTHPG